MNVIEIFSCAGGMAEGFRRGGLPVTMAFDWSSDAVESYERNIGHRPIQMDANDLLRLVQTGWRPTDGAIDLFVADPPCVSWSRAGKRLGTDDERDMIEPTIQLIVLLRPRAWLIANVPGLDDGPNLETVQNTIGSLAAYGYCIDFARLNASSYGVPQHRIRPWWYGHAMATPHIQWPERTHASPDECMNVTMPGVTPLSPWVTCRQALQHLPPKELGSPVRLRWRGQNGAQNGSIPDRPARVVGTSNLSDGNVLAHPTDANQPKDRRAQREPGRKARASHMDAPAGVVTSKPNQGDGTTLFDGLETEMQKAAAPDRKWAVRATHMDRPAGTLTCSTGANGRNLFDGDEALPEAPNAPSRAPRATHLDEPAGTVVAGARHNNGGVVFDGPDHRPSRLDAPARTLTKNTHSDGALLQVHGEAVDELVEVPHHPPSEHDEPSRTVRASSGTTADKILVVNDRHPINEADAPSVTVTARDRGAQGANALAWPWGRPSTTIQRDERIPPPGHKDENWRDEAGGRARSTPNAVKLSLRAAAILQGNVDGPCDGSHKPFVPCRPGDVCPKCGEVRRWHFCGATKLARWSSVGQQMPAPMAEAVARAIRKQMEASGALREDED